MFYPLSVFIGTRYIGAKRRNRFVSFISLASMMGLALGVLALILVLSVMNGFQREMSTRILGLVPHAVIQTEHPVTDWPALAQKALQNPAVVAAAPLTVLDGMLAQRNVMQPIQISGIDPQQEPRVSSLATKLVAGQLDALEAGQLGIIIGQTTAWRFRLRLGDTLTLIVPELGDSPGSITPRLHPVTVVGIFRVGAELDGSLAMMHQADVAQLLQWAPNQVQGVRLKLTDLHQAPEVARQLTEHLGTGFRVEDWTRTQGSLFSAMQMEKTMIGLLLMLIVAVAAFNIVATLIMVVTEKRADIAILRTLGATPAQIMGIFMVQGCLIGFSGTLLGAVLGVVSALYVSDGVAWLEQALGQRIFSADVYVISSLPSELHAQDVVVVVVTALLLSFLATLYPAWRASRTQPAQALRDA